jgi:hypothetical protein
MWFSCIFLIQAIQTLKLWYLVVVRGLRQALIVTFTLCTTATVVLISLHVGRSESSASTSSPGGCAPSYVPWTIFVPAYVNSMWLTMLMATVSLTCEQTIGTPLLTEFVSEGSLIYSTAFSVAFWCTGYLLVFASGSDKPSVSTGLPGVIALTLAITSISLSRSLICISVLLDVYPSKYQNSQEWINELVAFKRETRYSQARECCKSPFP